MNTLKKSSKKNKKTTKDKVVDKSTETNKDLSNVDKKHISEVLDSTKKIIDSIKEKLDQQEIEDTFIPEIESTFEVPVEIIEGPVAIVGNVQSSQLEIPIVETIIEDTSELAEELIDVVANSENSQMNMDFNADLDETVTETYTIYPQKMFDFLKENFEKTQQVVIKNTKEIVGFHTENINLAVNINQKVVENLNSQIELLLDLQNKGSH